LKTDNYFLTLIHRRRSRSRSDSVILNGKRDTSVPNEARRERSAVSSGPGRHTCSRITRSTMNEYHFRPAASIVATL
jgi:hypothetical protein